MAVPAADALAPAEPLVVVLSEDLALLQSMDEARFGGRYLAVASLERFVDQLFSGSVAVAIIDCSLVPAPTGQFMLRLREQFPCLALIAAGGGADQGAISRLIADGTICRFMHKPASGQRLAVFIEAALRRHEALLLEQPAAAPASPATGSRSPHRRSPRIVLLAAALSGVAAYFYWHYYESAAQPQVAEPTATERPSAGPADATAPAAAPQPAEALTPLRKLLDQARQRMDDGALLEPAGDNARQYIDSAHALAPDDPGVRAAALRLGDLIIAATRKAIAAGNSEEANRWLAAAADYHINSGTLDWLRQQVEALAPPAAPAAEPKP